MEVLKFTNKIGHYANKIYNFNFHNKIRNSQEYCLQIPNEVGI